MDIFLIRHGMTPGNREHCYIGRTDEPLSEEGRAALLPPAWGRLLLSAGVLAIQWLLLYFLYRKKVFLKV